MRTFQKNLAAAAAGAALLAVIGAAVAQAQKSGPEADMSNNERLTGIQNNTNNSYKTWPQSLYDTAPAESAKATSTAPVSTAQATQPPAATPDNSATSSAGAPATTDNSSMASSGTDDSSTMPPPRADRN